MKKFLLVLSLFVFASSVNIQAQQNVATEILNGNWATLVGSDGIDMCYKMDINDKGEIFFMHDVFTSPTNNVFFYGDKQFNGSGISQKPNGNPDFVLQKVDENGKLLMTLHSDRGYYMNSSPMIATKDGGNLLVLKMRTLDEGLAIPEDNGKTYMFRMRNSLDPDYVYAIEDNTIDHTNQGWVNKGYVLKLDKNGKVEWRRDINTDYNPVTVKNTKHFCSNMFDLEDVVEGPDGCFYILGRFARPLNIEGAPKQFIPESIPAEWDYDFVQNPAGDMFITKLDAQGNYKWTLTHSATKGITNEGAQRMAVDDKAIYVMGYLRGGADNQLTFGDKSVTVPNNAHKNQFLMKVGIAENAEATDSNVKVDFFKIIKTEADLKPMYVTVSDNKVIFGGSFKRGSILDEEGNKVIENTKGLYLGYTITASTVDGKIIAGAKHGYFKSINEVESAHLVGNNLYVAGYSLMDGGWIAELNKETLEDQKVYVAFKGSDFPTVQGSVLCKNKITVFGRGRRKPFIIGGLENSLTTPGQNYDILVANYTIPTIKDDTSSVEGVVTDKETMTVYGANNSINIIAAEEGIVNIYSVSGMLLKSMNVEAGSTAVEMPQGFYIVNGKKVIVY